jgi:hypothetical protein
MSLVGQGRAPGEGESRERTSHRRSAAVGFCYSAIELGPSVDFKKLTPELELASQLSGL